MVASLTIVQSLPVGNFSVGPVMGSLPTWQALTMLTNATVKSLDVTCMYMDLLGTEDRKIYSPQQMTQFGADYGVGLYNAMLAAAVRGVTIRILLGTLGDPINSTEVRQLLAHKNVKARTWDPTKWYGGGIMHAKLWVSDGERAYIGSANSDWKSLAQVKELGVLASRSPLLTADIGKLFEVFWQWADLTPCCGRTTTAFSEEYQAVLSLPAWDPSVPRPSRQPSPFAAQTPTLSTPYSLSNPMPLGLATLPSASGFVSGSPDGALVPDRTRDEDALVFTIRNASRSLSLSVMDFLPASDYSGGHGGAPVYWDALVAAILSVAFAKPVAVRLLVSHWSHTSSSQVAAMARLADGLAACRDNYQRCAGSLEVRQYLVPGWNASGDVWPSYSRVNHAKYIVTDHRVNIGTSNWQWGYFHNTAGASLNTDAPSLVSAAQAVFDADWESTYAIPLLPGA